MKRLITIVLTLAICVGVFAPVALSFGERGTLAIVEQTALAEGEATTASTDAAVKLADDPTGHIPTCSLLPGSNFNPGACIAWLTYYVPYDIGEWFMGVAARTFDIAASFTLSSKLYTSGSFLQQGWQITRDFANIFFILILLFIALSLVLDMEIGHANPKKMLATLVMVALVINFSFFITEVVIDISNSLALVFYNQVSVVGTTASGGTVAIDDKDINDQLSQAQGIDANGHKISYIQNEKPLSVALVQAMKPQILSSKEFYNKLCNDRFYGSPDATKTAQCADNSNNSGILIALFLLVGTMFIVTGYAFIVALGSLFGRMISLFIAIVFAPLAFVSLIVPSMAHLPGFGWDEWFSNLMKNAFAAPIFFFFILLISILSKSTIVPDVTTNLSAGVILLLVTIQFLILITMLLTATKYVKESSGAIGAALGGAAGALVKGLGGLAVGTAAGTIAIAGQRTIGAGMTKLARSEKFTKWATNKNSAFKRFAGEKLIKLGQGGSKASFDLRQNGAANAFSSATGINLGSVGALSTKRTMGGLMGAAEYKAKKDEEFANSLRKNQTQEDTLNKNLDERKKLITEKEDLLEKRKADVKAFEEGSLKPLEAAFKKAEKDLDITLKDKTSSATEIAAAKKNFQDARDALDNGKKVTTNTAGQTYKDVETELKNAEKEMQELQRGVRDASGKQIKLTTAGQLKADGTKATANDIKEGVVDVNSLSIKDFEELIETNKKANAKAYLYNQAKGSGYHTTAKYDKMGNVKGFHIDTTQKEARQTGNALARMFSSTLLEGGLGTALGFAIAGPIGGVLGAKLGGLSGFLKEADTGYSFKDAEAAHHTAEPHEGGAHGGHESHGYNPPGGGVLAELSKLFGAATGGGGGGGGGHGGGGHGGH